MKGIILSEFIEFLEVRLGEDTAQSIINDSQIKTGGAYSRVGLYDYQELLQLLNQTVVETSQEAGDLLQEFSDHLFMVFKRDYHTFFEGVGSAGEMLTQIDNHIHVEVKKLYPDAELPKFDYTKDHNVLTLNYSSPRPLAAVAYSLVNACLKYFGESEHLVSTKIAEDQCSATFVIQMSS